jgi:hypothetical protein
MTDKPDMPDPLARSTLTALLLLFLCSCSNDARKAETKKSAGALSSRTATQTATKETNQAFENAPIQLLAGTPISLTVELMLPKGYHLNSEAPSGYQISLSEGDTKTDSLHHHILEGKLSSRYLHETFEPLDDMRSGVLHLSVSVFYCREDGKGACLLRTLKFLQPFSLSTEVVGTSSEVHFLSTLTAEEND